MERWSPRELVVFCLLVAGAVTARVYFQYLPNVAPVAAVALFAGYYFRHGWMAVLVPLTVMWISDFWIGGYHPGVMIAVYAMLILPALIGRPLRRSAPLAGRSAKRVMGSGFKILGCAVASSVAFFVVTNLATWWCFSTYPNTLNGLVECFVSALPFYRYTFGGDILFAVALFGSYAGVLQIAPAFRHAWAPRPHWS